MTETRVQQLWMKIRCVEVQKEFVEEASCMI